MGRFRQYIAYLRDTSIQVMIFFKRLFAKAETGPQIQCPRCLGKGHVDHDDIKRLKKELKWGPGKCAYCNGKGRVADGQQLEVPVDETFLTSDLSSSQRKKNLARDPKAIEWAKRLDTNYDNLVKQILHLHYAGNMNVEQIALFYLVPEPKLSKQNAAYRRNKKELLDYITFVIEQSK